MGRDAGARRRARRRGDGVVAQRRDVTAAYPELEELGRDYKDMLLDGEVVALKKAQELPRPHRADARAQRRRAQRLAATRPVTLMACCASSGPTSPTSRGPHEGHCSTGSTSVAGTGRCPSPTTTGHGCSRPRRSRAGGHREQAAQRAVCPWAAGPQLAQDRAPQQPVGRGGWLATGGRVERTARCRARGPARRRRRLAVCRPRGLGPGGHRGRGPGRRLRPLRRDTSPFADESPRSTPTAPAWSSRGSSSRCAPRGSSPASTGCASRPTWGARRPEPAGPRGGRRCLSSCPR